MDPLARTRLELGGLRLTSAHPAAHPSQAHPPHQAVRPRRRWARCAVRCSSPPCINHSQPQASISRNCGPQSPRQVHESPELVRARLGLIGLGFSHNYHAHSRFIDSALGPPNHASARTRVPPRPPPPPPAGPPRRSVLIRPSPPPRNIVPPHPPTDNDRNAQRISTSTARPPRHGLRRHQASTPRDPDTIVVSAPDTLADIPPRPQAGDLNPPSHLQSPEPRTPDPERSGLCVICQDDEAIMVTIDCGHLAMCRECSDAVMSSSRTCPLCRTNIAEGRLIRVFKT
ncbi:hypothetical protein C8R45DRAFT_963988 [Mycena sanguinolenta]|nr:hypothetical protein C8R45DRAFT_963988 [Mycena sanguinolenta]